MRQCLCFIVCLLCSMAVLVASEEEMSDQRILDILQTEQEEDTVINKGLAWIRDQQRDDGSTHKGDHRTAMTAFAIMAHLSAGITFTDPQHGEWLGRSLNYVLNQQEANGYFGKKDNSRMYGHGVVTLMLAEAIGMIEDDVQEEATRESLERAVALTIWAATTPKKKKEHAGGWHYQPNQTSSDLSLSGWQLMSLHAAQQVGITVPEKVVTKACAYAKRLITKEGKVGYNKPGADHPALRGLGMLSFAVINQEDDPLVDAVATRIEKYPIEWKGSWFYYRSYYDAVGLSRTRPEVWLRYKDNLQQILVENQSAEGYWGSPPGDNEANRFGKIYSTSMAILALAVDRHVLPAYQR